MRSLLCWCFLLIVFFAEAQSVLNDKSFYDTLLPVKTYGKIGLGVNINDDGAARNVFIFQNAAISRAKRFFIYSFRNKQQGEY
jgi:hypothetical protein